MKKQTPIAQNTRRLYKKGDRTYLTENGVEVSLPTQTRTGERLDLLHLHRLLDLKLSAKKR